MNNFNAAIHFIDRHVTEGRGENVAIECNDERITYRKLSENVNRAGNALLKLGIKKGDRILIILPDMPEFFMCFFGAIKIGAVPVPINTLLTPDDYRFYFDDSEARAVIVHESLKGKMAGLTPVIVVGKTAASEISFSELIAKNSADLTAGQTTRDDVALWLYTSGSTGNPKACVHLQHDMAVAAEHYAIGVLAMTEKDKCFSVGKLFFAYGLGNSLFCPLQVGAATILMPNPPKPDAIFETITKHRPTLFFSMPSNYLRLLDYADEANKDFDLSSIRVFTSAGEPLPRRLADRFKQKFGGEILDSIGATELFIFTANRPGSNRPGSSGQLLPGYEAKILDDDGKPVGVDEVGNLLIKSDSVCSSYWKQPEKSKSVIDGNWFRTGDKCHQDADGFIWYVGRADDMFKSNGAWVSPLEVENTLMEHPCIASAAIIGEKDEDGLMQPIAYIVLRENIAQTPKLFQELQEFAKVHLPKFKRPRRIMVIHDLPRTTNGKLQRFKLRQLSG